MEDVEIYFLQMYLYAHHLSKRKGLRAFNKNHDQIGPPPSDFIYENFAQRLLSSLWPIMVYIHWSQI